MREERPRVISMRKLARSVLEKSASSGAVKTRDFVACTKRKRKVLRGVEMH